MNSRTHKWLGHFWGLNFALCLAFSGWVFNQIHEVNWFFVIMASLSISAAVMHWSLANNEKGQKANDA